MKRFSCSFTWLLASVLALAIQSTGPFASASEGYSPLILGLDNYLTVISVSTSGERESLVLGWTNDWMTKQDRIIQYFECKGAGVTNHSCLPITGEAISTTENRPIFYREFRQSMDRERLALDARDKDSLDSAPARRFRDHLGDAALVTMTLAGIGTAYFGTTREYNKAVEDRIADEERIPEAEIVEEDFMVTDHDAIFSDIGTKAFKILFIGSLLGALSDGAITAIIYEHDKAVVKKLSLETQNQLSQPLEDRLEKALTNSNVAIDPERRAIITSVSDAIYRAYKKSILNAFYILNGI